MSQRVRARSTICTIVCWHEYHLWLLLCYNGRIELSQQKLDGQKKPESFIIWPFQKTFADVALS